MSENNEPEIENRKTDLNDELDYEEEENHISASNNNNNIINKKQTISTIDEDSDGEIKSDNQDDLDDGEVPSPKKDKNNDENEDDVSKNENKEEEKHSEEEGEINDGEKVKKAFIPRVLCKYYQRGKCTWGRTCKFLHPGVNDTGSYTFLEYQDPAASLNQQKTGENIETDPSKQQIPGTEVPQTESAWERGLRIAREMKEKALKRKQMEKDQFDDKKMNLSLKEFENEKENDERYVNVEMANNADDDLDDEELNLFANSGRIRSNNNERNTFRADNPRSQNNRFESSFDPRRSGAQNDQRSRQIGRNMPNRSPNRETVKSRADEWHDPWERSRQNKKNSNNTRRDRSNSYSSSDSDSRSRSRSRSSNSTKSSYSYSSRSSSRSRSPTSKKDRQNKASGNKSSTTSKLAPGRQISESSLKKVSGDSKGKRKSSKTRSDSSASSYSSSSDDDGSKSGSDSEIDSYSDEDQGKKKKSSNHQARASMKASLKRAGEDLKNLIESKKSKPSTSPTNKQSASTKGTDKDKKQLIKDQLKLLESALNKKKQMNK